MNETMNKKIELGIYKTGIKNKGWSKSWKRKKQKTINHNLSMPVFFSCSIREKLFIFPESPPPPSPIPPLSLCFIFKVPRQLGHKLGERHNCDTGLFPCSSFLHLSDFSPLLSHDFFPCWMQVWQTTPRFKSSLQELMCFLWSFLFLLFLTQNILPVFALAKC